MVQVSTTFLAVAATLATQASAFVIPASHHNAWQSQHAAAAGRSNNSALYAQKKTLTEETTWKLRFLLQGLPTEKGKKVDEIFSIDAQFIEEMGYEPPQGRLQQIGLEGSIKAVDTTSSDEGKEDNSQTPRLKIANSRWLLSEDPEDRKDGLWVWGLFAEPLYPFLLLQLETERVPLPGEDEDAIKPLKLFAQMTHQREKDVGVILKGGELKIREMETIKADPFGAATVEIYDEVSIGKISVESE